MTGLIGAFKNKFIYVDGDRVYAERKHNISDDDLRTHYFECARNLAEVLLLNPNVIYDSYDIVYHRLKMLKCPCTVEDLRKFMCIFDERSCHLISYIVWNYSRHVCIELFHHKDFHIYCVSNDIARTIDREFGNSFSLRAPIGKAYFLYFDCRTEDEKDPNFQVTDVNRARWKTDDDKRKILGNYIDACLRDGTSRILDTYISEPEERKYFIDAFLWYEKIYFDIGVYHMINGFKITSLANWGKIKDFSYTDILYSIYDTNKNDKFAWLVSLDSMFSIMQMYMEMTKKYWVVDTDHSLGIRLFMEKSIALHQLEYSLKYKVPIESYPLLISLLEPFCNHEEIADAGYCNILDMRNHDLYLDSLYEFYDDTKNTFIGYAFCYDIFKLTNDGIQVRGLSGFIDACCKYVESVSTESCDFSNMYLPNDMINLDSIVPKDYLDIVRKLLRTPKDELKLSYTDIVYASARMIAIEDGHYIEQKTYTNADITKLMVLSDVGGRGSKLAHDYGDLPEWLKFDFEDVVQRDFAIISEYNLKDYLSEFSLLDKFIFTGFISFSNVSLKTVFCDSDTLYIYTGAKFRSPDSEYDIVGLMDYLEDTTEDGGKLVGAVLLALSVVPAYINNPSYWICYDLKSAEHEIANLASESDNSISLEYVTKLRRRDKQ